jgi:DNA-binding NarL/FixJ family response regulator
MLERHQGASIGSVRGGRAVAIKVIIADDHEIIRRGLAKLLADEGIAVVAEAASGREAISKTRKHKPDIVLMDVRMSNMDGLDALNQIRKMMPDAKVIMMSGYDNPTYTARAAALGAKAFLTKDVPVKVYISTVQRVARGQEPTEDARLRTMKADLEQRPDPAVDAVPLTKREYQVLRHLARGLSDREVASSLGISVETVKGYVRLIILKLRTRDRTEAAVWAAKRGLV